MEQRKSYSIILFLFLLNVSVRTDLSGITSDKLESAPSNITQQDTIKERQILFNGIMWTNKYHRINDDQFLFSDFFLPGTLSINGQTFKNIMIRYDIYSDEIMTPLNMADIVQLNKEMVDSFTINFENKVYNFTKIQDETLKGFQGYYNVLYKRKSALYIKYKKEISLSLTDTHDGEFYKNNRIYFVKDSIIYPITRTNDLFKILSEDKIKIRNFIKNNKLKVSKKIPESFVPVIRYYDSLSQ
jgi:hypothetical protein